MQDLYLVYSRTTILPPLGYGILSYNEEETEVQENLIIAPFKNFPYFNKRYEKALNGGVISQLLYNTIIINQMEGQQIEIFYNLNIQIDKEVLMNLINHNTIQNINTELNTASIVKQLREQNFIIVKKL
jgi:hypothetical protein